MLRFRELWLAMVLLLALLIGACLLISALSVKSMLEQQLAMKNSDNAAALALSLTQQGADPVLLELTLSAQFDTGFYQMIELTDPQGNVSIRREDDQPHIGSPAWFRRLFPMDVEPGVASIQNGWQQVGTLTLRSHYRFAYEDLWEMTLRLFALFIVASLIAGLLSKLVIKRLQRSVADRSG